MRSSKTIARKAAKARARRKAYEKTRNLNANVPTREYTIREPRYKQVHIREGGPVIMSGGRPKLEHDGYRDRTIKRPVYSNPDPSNKEWPAKDANGRYIGMAAYPLRKKFKAPKNA